jgi:hypothetical protein
MADNRYRSKLNEQRVRLDKLMKKVEPIERSLRQSLASPPGQSSQKGLDSIRAAVLRFDSVDSTAQRLRDEVQAGLKNN